MKTNNKLAFIFAIGAMLPLNISIAEPETPANGKSPANQAPNASISIEKIVEEKTDEENKPCVWTARDKKKDKPIEFSGSISMTGCYDFQEGTAGNDKFGPTLFDKKCKDILGGFWGASLGVKKTINIFEKDLTFNFEIEKDDKSLAFSKYYISVGGLTFGQAPGNFNIHMPANFRYAVHQISYKFNPLPEFSLTVALEQGQKLFARSDEDKDENGNVECKVNETIDGKSKEHTVKTTAEKPEVSKTHTVKGILPNLALAMNTIYKFDIGNVGLAGVFAPVMTYYGKKGSGSDQKFHPMFAAALNTKIVAIKNSELEKDEQLVITSHIKYMNGAGGYGRECGGLPKSFNPNFALDKDGKITDTVKSVGASLGAKYIFTNFLSTSLSLGYMHLVNSDEVNKDKKKEDKYCNALTGKISPTFKVYDNFSIAPNVTIGMKNLTGDGESDFIGRLGISISYDF